MRNFYIVVVGSFSDFPSLSVAVRPISGHTPGNSFFSDILFRHTANTEKWTKSTVKPRRPTTQALIPTDSSRSSSHCPPCQVRPVIRCMHRSSSSTIPILSRAPRWSTLCRPTMRTTITTRRPSSWRIAV